MAPRVSARRPAPVTTTLRGQRGQRGRDGLGTGACNADAGPRGNGTSRADGERRPSSRTVDRDGVQRASPGRMRKGETPKERGEQTRARIAEAMLDLMAEAELAPTAKDVATRAGVSVRLVFHHFEDMDALYRTVSRAQFERHWRGLRPVDGDLPIDQRIDRTVKQRARLFDAVSPVRRKAIPLAARHHDVVQEGLQLTNNMLRSWLEETFAAELQAAGRERRELLGALEVAASWESWERLRRTQGLSTATARRVLTRTLRALLHA